MKPEICFMTNRELFVEYESNESRRHYEILTEMAKRINRKMITKDIIPIFKQYKLNGAGDQRY